MALAILSRWCGSAVLHRAGLLLLASIVAGQAALAATLRITEPAADQTIHDNAGNLTVRITLEGLANTPSEMAHVRIMLDGRQVAEGSGRQFQLSNIDRGSHEVQAQLVDSSGKVVGHSEPVRFHLWQASRLNRASGR